MAHIGVMIGGLLPTFFVSRLVLWLMKSWPNGYDKLLAAHGVSVLVCGFLAGLGMADGGPFAGARAAALHRAAVRLARVRLGAPPQTGSAATASAGSACAAGPAAATGLSV